MRRERVAVVGNSVAAMMATLELAREGNEVVLVTPTATLGAHFAGLAIDGHRFDAGMVFLEFTAFNADPAADLRSYDPHVRNDAGRFVLHVERTLGRFGDWVAVPPPAMWFQGERLPDLVIANRLEALRSLPPGVREAMRAELGTIVAAGRGDLHASQKARGAAYEHATLDTASLANHGATFHGAIIDPLCRRLTGVPSSDLLARYHRTAWAPLFHPETMLAVLDGAGTPWPPTTFSAPRSGMVAHLVGEMAQTLARTPGVTIRVGTVEQLHRDASMTSLTVGGDRFDVAHLVWAGDPDPLLALAGLPVPHPLARASLTLAFAAVPSTALRLRDSTLLVPAGDGLPFRVTDHTFAAGLDAPTSLLTLEWHGNDMTADADAPTRVLGALRTLGVLGDGNDAAVRIDLREFRNALPLPTPSNLAIAKQRDHLLDERLPDVVRIGQASPFGATSLNDQVVQGLRTPWVLGARP